MMLGKMADEVPSGRINIWVDVRDLALAHARAAERSDAAGKRFFVTAGYYSNRELADNVQELLPDVRIAANGGEFPKGQSSKFWHRPDEGEHLADSLRRTFQI